MRAQLNKTISRLFLKNKKMFLVLGDIGVYGFKDLLESKRAVNIGILEQATISFASGLSKIGIFPEHLSSITLSNSCSLTLCRSVF